MVKTYRKLLVRSVRKTAARFLSILAIVALGVGFLGGLLATTPDMEKTADRYYDDCRMYDFDVKGTMGITDADIAALSQMDGVEHVMPARVTDLEMQSDANSYVTRIYGMDLSKSGTGELINDFVLLEGRLPENPGECLIASPNGYAGGHSIGEVYTVSDNNKNYDSLSDTYAFTQLTVVGIVQTPQYMSIERENSTVGSGNVGLIMYVFPEAYSLEVYTDAFITLEGAAAMNSFSDEYADLLDRFGDQLEAFGTVRSTLRYQEVRSEAQAELDDARGEYETARADADQQLSDARQKLDDARQKLSDSRQELADARRELDDGWAELNRAKQQLEDAKLQLVQKEAELSQAQDQLEAQITAQKTELETQRPYLSQQQYAYALAQIEEAYQEGLVQLNSGRIQLTQAKAEISQAEAEIAASQQTLDDGETDYASGVQKLADAEDELNDAEAEYADSAADADRELADAAQKLDDAQAQIDDLEQPEWFLFDRRDNTSFHSYQGNAEKVDAIARVFPIFFFLVAALVSLTTMTRMVEEERVQIGTLKALGYTDGAIIFYYVGYSVLASLLGGIVGIIPGFKILPHVISGAYSMMYTLPETVIVFYWGYALIIIPIAVVCVAAATLWACLDQLHEKPCSLMLPKAPKAGKRIFLERIGFVWNRLKFIQKVTARNIFRYKKRLFMTVFGIAGCCALLVTGFGLRDSIHDIVDKQFGELYQYDLMVMLKNEDAITQDAIIREFLEDTDTVRQSAVVHSENGKAVRGNDTQSVALYIGATPEDITKSITLRDRKTGDPVLFDGHGVVLTEKLCEQLHISVGDTITLRDENEQSASFTVSGICENYVTAYAFIGADEYRAAFGKEPEYNLLLIGVTDSEASARDRISAELLQSDNILALQFSQTIRESFSNTVKSIDSIVLVLIAAAGMLAVVVLYNLTNINICERKKELATIKVLGFYEKEVASYIYRETSVLCVLGILAGFGFGAWLHSFVVRTAEIDAIMFGRSASALSYLLAALITILFTVIVDLIMLKKLRGIDMVESMKANE